MEQNNRSIQTIGILGGTGKEGKGLGYRWARAGYKILIGSRSLDRAKTTAGEINALLGENIAKGLTNEAVVCDSDITVLTVPYSAHRAILKDLKAILKNKILIDVTVPLIPPKLSTVQMPPEGSALLEAIAIVDESTIVIDAFQNISHELLLNDGEIQCDVLVCGGDKNARQIVLGLVKDMGLTGWDAGPKENSVVVEGFTSILIGINKRYNVKSSGILITGVN